MGDDNKGERQPLLKGESTSYGEDATGDVGIQISVPPVASMPGMHRVTCGHCSDSFLFSTLDNALARCPHCRKVSSVEQAFANRRGIIFLMLGLIFLSIGIGVTLGTYVYARNHKGIYVVYIGAFVVGIFLLARGLYYCFMKVSNIEGPM